MTKQQPASGFNWARLSMGSKGLLVSGLLLAIACFLTWADVGSEVEAITGVDISDLPGSPDTGLNAMGTSPLFGTLALIAALGVVVWEGLLAAGVNVSAGSNSPAMVSAIIGWPRPGSESSRSSSPFRQLPGERSWACSCRWRWHTRHTCASRRARSERRHRLRPPSQRRSPVGPG